EPVQEPGEGRRRFGRQAPRFLRRISRGHGSVRGILFADGRSGVGQAGIGQTEATPTLCSSIPGLRRVHYVQKGVGHYGVFNGSRFKSEIVPRISDFMVSAANAKPSLPAAAE